MLPYLKKIKLQGSIRLNMQLFLALETVDGFYLFISNFIL